MSDAPTYHLGLARISGSLFPDLLATAMCLPEGMKVLRVAHDPPTDSWVVVVEDGRLPAVSFGAVPPELALTYTETYDPDTGERVALGVEVSLFDRADDQYVLASRLIRLPEGKP